jgi:hypothetical protein
MSGSVLMWCSSMRLAGKPGETVVGFRRLSVASSSEASKKALADSRLLLRSTLEEAVAQVCAARGRTRLRSDGASWLSRVIEIQAGAEKNYVAHKTARRPGLHPGRLRKGANSRLVEIAAFVSS